VNWAWISLDVGIALDKLIGILNQRMVLLQGAVKSVVASLLGWHSVMSHGAKGDGVTNDSLAIQAAVAACQTAGGGRVYFPHPKSRYYTGTTTINVTANGVVFEFEDSATYISYAGTGYAVSFALSGSAQMHDCGMSHMGILCTNAAGSAVYAKSPYGFYITQGYAENGITGTTGVGVTLDGGISIGGIQHTGTGYFGTHNRISHVRCSGFKTGFLFKGGSLSGWDITTASVIEECFANGLLAQAGTVGVEFQGSQQCAVRGGNLESLETAIKLTNSPGACQGIIIDSVRFEGITTNNWVIPAGATNCKIISPDFDVDNGSNLATDTMIVSNLEWDIPRFAAASLPAWSASKTGFVAWDTTNNRLVGYGTASRHYFTPSGTF
jgi:polygalacturonase